MCSVVGYIGKNLAKKYVFQGLARLEYRGYDAAGFACLEPISNKILYAKSSGQLNNLVEQVQKTPINGFLGIGHTRWSTHGDFSQKNSHPHFDCTHTISVVHNGIIENHHLLRTELESLGHIFQSSTDTEVITHLFESLLKQKNALHESVLLLVQQLQGSYALVMMMCEYPDMLLVVRKRSPLCVGVGNNEMFIASDSVAFAGNVESVFFMPDNSIAYVHKNSLKAYSFSGEVIVPVMHTPDVLFSATEKGQYEHFMLKEIYEQRGAIETTVSALSLLHDALWNQIGIACDEIKSITRIALIGCGTSWHAARIAQFFFENIVGIPVDVYLASELRYASFFPCSTTLYIFISQSGETADTLEALNMVNAYAQHTVTLSNSATSTMVREARGYLLTYAGVEIAVASTKAFSTQLTALYWLAYRVALERNSVSNADMLKAESDLVSAAHLLENVLERYRQHIELHVAPQYACYDKMLFLGKHISYPFALESALKLKEIAYVFAECHPSGELKHGSLALVDENVPVFIFSHQDSLIYQKLLSNAHAVHSRGGKIIAFAYEDQEELCKLAETFFVMPHVLPPLLGPLVMTGVMQFLMYCIARERGCPIDKPRNLAKSVTVE